MKPEKKKMIRQRVKARNITGAILAGGRSSRLRCNKALLDLNGKPFIQHVAETMHTVFAEVMIVASESGEYDFLGLPICADVYKDCGPLAGIHAVLVAAKNDAAFIVPCDTPFLTPAFIRSVLARAGRGDATIALGGNSLQPLCGVYKRSCLPVIEKELQRGQYSVRGCLKKLRTSILSPPLDVQRSRVHPLMNINTPDDYARCLDIVRGNVVAHRTSSEYL